MHDVVKKATALKALDLETCSDDEVLTRFRDFGIASSYTGLGISLDTSNIWHRGRLLAPVEPIKDSLYDLIYPQKPSPRYGRFSCPGERVFYASWNRATVDAELLPVVLPPGGQTIQYIISRPRADVQITALVIGAYEHFFHTGRFFFPAKNVEDTLAAFFATTPEAIIKKTLYADAFLAALFRQPDDSLYKLSSVVGRYFLGILQPTAVLYPSVKTVASLNLAVQDRVFDNCFEVLLTGVCHVVRSYGHGVVDRSWQRPTHGFGTDGSIDWAAPLEPSIFSVTTGFTFPVDTPAWRVAT